MLSTRDTLPSVPPGVGPTFPSSAAAAGSSPTNPLRAHFLLSEAAVAGAADAAAAAAGLRRSGRRTEAASGSSAAQRMHKMHGWPSTLVIVPRPLLRQWEAELAKHTAPNALRVAVFAGAPTSKRKAAAAVAAAAGGGADGDEAESLAFGSDVVLTTFDVVAAQPGWEAPRCGATEGAHHHRPSPLLRVHWLRVVLDEAHCCRAAGSAPSRFVCALSCECVSICDRLAGEPSRFAQPK